MLGMGNLLIGIDTSKDKGKRSKGKRLIGVVVGTPQGISKFVSAIDSTARSHGFNGTLHWKYIKTKELRDKILTNHITSLKECGIEAMIFPAVRFDKEKRGYYLKECPWGIGGRLIGFIESKTDKMVITSDSDFNSLAPASEKESKQSTFVFLDRLITKIGTEVAMAPLSAKREGVELYQVVLRKGGKPLTLRGKIGSQEDMEIRAADIVLGMYVLARSKNKRMEKVRLEGKI